MIPCSAAVTATETLFRHLFLGSPGYLGVPGRGGWPVPTQGSPGACLREPRALRSTFRTPRPCSKLLILQNGPDVILGAVGTRSQVLLPFSPFGSLLLKCSFIAFKSALS